MTPWLQTHTGLAFDLEDITSEQVDVADIAHALARQCRYNGHPRDHYSVAEHCCLVADWVEQHAPRHDFATPQEYALAGLLHDAGEAYLGDLAAPLKRTMPPAARAWWDSLTVRVDWAICEAVAARDVLLHASVVKEADLRILHDEAAAIWGDHRARPWGIPGEPLGVEVRFWDAGKARHEWLARLGRWR